MCATVPENVVHYETESSWRCKHRIAVAVGEVAEGHRFTQIQLNGSLKSRIT